MENPPCRYDIIDEQRKRKSYLVKLLNHNKDYLETICFMLKYYQDLCATLSCHLGTYNIKNECASQKLLLMP